MEEEEERDQRSWRASRLFMPDLLFTPPCRFGFSADHRGSLFSLLSLYGNWIDLLELCNVFDWILFFLVRVNHSKLFRIATPWMDTPNSAIHRGPFHMGGWPACAYRHRATDTITIATSGSNRTSGAPWRRSCLAPSHRHNCIGVAETRSWWFPRLKECPFVLILPFGTC